MIKTQKKYIVYHSWYTFHCNKGWTSTINVSHLRNSTVLSFFMFLYIYYSIMNCWSPSIWQHYPIGPMQHHYRTMKSFFKLFICLSLFLFYKQQEGKRQSGSCLYYRQDHPLGPMQYKDWSVHFVLVNDVFIFNGLLCWSSI